MADENTPKSSDDAVDPSQSPSPEGAQPVAESETADVAARVRSARPRRKPTAPQAAPADPSQAAPADPPQAAPAARTQDAPDARETGQQTPSIPRPVRRRPVSGGASAAPAPRKPVDDESPRPSTSPDATSRNPVVAAPRKREATPTVAQHKRTTPAAFVGQSADELRKVIWPTRQQLTAYFVVVLAFVLFIVAYVGGLDVFFGWLLLKLFGK